MILIGIAGKAGSGKDTVAEHLWTEHGFLRTAFADPLKAAAVEIFGLSHNHFTDRTLKEAPMEFWGMSPRQILQIMGTEAMKPHFGDDVWLKRWFLTYKMFKDSDHIVVSDVRFDLEADAIRKLGGLILHLERPTETLTGETAQHVSESGITVHKEDVTIVNDGTIEGLRMALDMLVQALEERE